MSTIAAVGLVLWCAVVILAGWDEARREDRDVEAQTQKRLNDRLDKW
jgi:hypothetical protein